MRKKSFWIKMLSKKGEVMGEVVMWLARIIFAFVVIGIIVFLVNGSIEKNLDLGDLRFYSVAERVLYSGNCFALENSGRIYPGIIDLKRFTQESLDKCMLPLDRPIGSRVTMQYGDKEIVLFFNKEYYDDLVPLAFSRQYVHAKKRYFVLADDGTAQIPGNILVEVAWRK